MAWKSSFWLEGKVVKLVATGFSHTLVSSHIRRLATSKFKIYLAKVDSDRAFSGRMYGFVEQIRCPLWKEYLLRMHKGAPFLAVSFQSSLETITVWPRYSSSYLSPTTLMPFKCDHCLRTLMLCTLHSTGGKGWTTPVSVVEIWSTYGFIFPNFPGRKSIKYRCFNELFDVQSPTFGSWWDSRKMLLFNEGLF